MEVVVFHSDISRLVLGYLKNQRLKRAARVFCKTSPHLRQEFSAFKHGLQAHSFFPDLEDIICAYVKITRKMEQVLASMPIGLRTDFEHKKVAEKVIELMERASQVLLRETPVVNTRIEDAVAGGASGPVMQSDKENNTHKPGGKKRKRADNSADYSSDEQQKSLHAVSKRKRRHVLQPFCYLNDKRDGVRQQSSLTIASTSTCDENSDDNSHESAEDDNETTSKLEDDDSVDLSINNRHVNESTPKPSTSRFVAPTLPEISQAILENPEFQSKLVDNINQALLRGADLGGGELGATSEVPTFAAPHNAGSAVVGASDFVPAKTTTDEQEILTSNQLLDQMVQSILDATEKDPAFDAIIQEVVEASNKGTASAGIQCNLQNPIASTSAPVACGPAELTQTCVGDPVNKPVAALANPPRTPLVIRTAIAAANSDPQTLPSFAANASFGSLIDPNYSISKLIVLNSNESAQKQPPAADQTIAIGNQTADNILNQLTSATQPAADDQIYFDATSGQLTFPLFLTTDGLLTNFPFLINNEVVTQQLQPDNIANLDASRIEIPLAEPIIVSADQLPPNSIIVGSTQKKDEKAAQEKQQRTVSKLKADSNAVPASLDSRIIAERVTPSTSGIMNVKAFKSLSTPRKRTSHVRTLTFSPKTATPLSSRREVAEIRVPKAIAEEVSEKPIIKNIEILRPPTSMDNSANESSNSSHVPLAYGSEGSNNQTVIKNDGGTKASEQHVDTPKKKQRRQSALRACKRRLSKSSNEEESVELEKQKAAAESVPSTDATDAAKTDTKDELLSEWRRMRSAGHNDLDVRLRELNSKHTGGKAIKKEPPKRVRRKKPVAVKKLQRSAQAKAAEEAELRAQDSTEDESGKQKPKNKEQKSKDLKEFRIKMPTPQKHEKARIKIFQKEEEKANQEIKATEAPPEILLSHASEVTQPPTYTRELLERRTNNIACLLETPFKEPSASLVPPTPGVLAPLLDTPLSKLLPPDDDRLSTSYLFGSLTKSELGTPLLNAITPGLRFTPYATHDGTPRSAAATEYSSGGSYYRPDESEDVNQRLDAILRSSAHKQAGDETGMTPTQPPPSARFEIVNSPAQPYVELPLEKLKVEPIVLKRVKSFGMDGADAVPTEAPPIDMHYTLAPGLPDLQDGSSSESSSSTFSSSSSSSRSSTAGSNKSAKNGIKTPFKTSLDQLSDISSSEDTDWQKLELNPNENSQLVNNEGEVRYPVRSWLTPQKAPAGAAPMTLMVPLKSAEKLPNELELKRARIKTKLEQDRLQLAQKPKPKQKNVAPPKSNKAAAIDVLTALNLSAKKQPTNERTTLPMADIDDNAVSNIFKPDVVPPKLGQRKTQLIERLPITKSKPTRQKRVVRTPLGFQGTAVSLAEGEGQKEQPAIKVKQSTSDATSSAGTGASSASRVSPRIKSRAELSDELEKKDVDGKFKTPAKPTAKSSTAKPRGKAKQVKEAATAKEANKPTATPKSQQVGKVTTKAKPKAREKKEQKKVVAKKVAEKSTVDEGDKGDDKGIGLKAEQNRDMGLKGAEVGGKKKEKREIERKEEAKGKMGGTAVENKSGDAMKKQNKSGDVTKKEKKSEDVMQKEHKSEDVMRKENKTVASGEEQNEQISSQKGESNKQAKNEVDKQERPKKFKDAKGPSLEEELLKETPKRAINDPPSASVQLVVTQPTTTAPPDALKTPPSTGNRTSQHLPPKSAPTHIPTSDEEDDDELDPIDCCQLVSIPESDTKRIVSLADNRSVALPQTAPIRHDFADFKMVVNIDEHESYTWRISEEIVIFSCEPQKEEAIKAIRNIPKKRRIRIITSSSSDESAAIPSAIPSAASSMLSNCCQPSQDTNQPSDATPGATSTPVAKPRIYNTISQPQKHVINLSAESDQNTTPNPHSPSFVKPSQELVEVSPVTHAASPALAAPEVEIVDIETILSHLHGE